LHCKPDAVGCGVVLLEQCIDEIEQWMAANRLKLNADKTELRWTGTCSQLNFIYLFIYLFISLIHQQSLTQHADGKLNTTR